MAVRRWKYGMRHSWLFGNRIGLLHPCFYQEVVPGDTWAGKSAAIVRMAPLDQPAFVQLNMHVHFFFVPHRLVWDEFEDFITGVSTPTYPTVNRDDASGNWTVNSALGTGPAASTTTYAHNALPVRAFNLVYNEFFRDQDEDAALSLDNLQLPSVRYPATSYLGGVRSAVQQGSEEQVTVTAGQFNVTELRDALHRQKFRERRSQFGERYTDYLMAMGLSVPDSRLDRPEHVARARSTLGISEVVATATSAGENTGEYRGHGISGISVNFRKRNFVEHGSLIGVFYARPRLQIRHARPYWCRMSTKDQYFHQELARNTQVTVDDGELDSKSPTFGTYGYVRRDDWLRKPQDVLASTMQHVSNVGWNTGRDFSGTVPALGTVNIVDPYNTLFQDQSGSATQMFVYMDHAIGKRSMVPKNLT